MPLTNRSTILNATVASVSGPISAGFAVCTTSPQSGFVVATTANRAAVNDEIAGIAVTSGNARNPIVIVASGYCDPDEVGIIGGTGDFVEVTSTGSLTRAAAISDNTVGRYTYEGGVRVDLGLRDGGAVTGNATAIQGTAVTSATATRSYVMAADGTNIRMRRGVKNAADYGIAADGSTDDTTALQTLLDAGGEIVLPAGTYLWTKPLKVTVKGTNVRVECADSAPTSDSAFVNCRPRLYEPHGTGASITAYGNGGSGSNMMTIALGTYTGSTPTGSYSGGGAGKRVLAADAADWIGRWISIPTAVGMTAGVGGEWQITSVPSDDTITVQGGASASDSGLHWRINIPAIIVCARSVTLQGFNIAPYDSSSGARQWCAFEVNYNQLAGAAAQSIANTRFIRCTVNVTGSGSFRHAWSIARNVVPVSGDPNYSVNGAGVRQSWAPTQVDTISWFDCQVYMAPNLMYAEAAIEHASGNGQSRDCHWYGGNIYARHPYLNPQRGSSGSSGQVDFHDCTFSTPHVLATTGGSNSRPRRFINCYAENLGRIVHDRGSGSSETLVIDGGYGFSSTSLHPSGALIETASLGPFEFSSQVHGTDSTKMHLMELSSNSTTKEQDVKIDAHVRGSTTFTGVRAHLDSTTTVGGLLRFAGTETFGLTIDGAAASFTCSQANFNSANGITVDLNWVQPWMFMLLTQTQQSGSRCWADADGYRMHVSSATEGTGGSVQVTTNTTMTVWPAFSISGLAQQLISKDTAGLVCINRGAGSSTDPAAVRLDYDVRHCVVSSDAVVTHERFRKRYYSVASGGECLEGVSGIASRNTRVRPKNFNGTQAFANGDTSKTVAFATTEDDASYKVSGLVVRKTAGTPAAAAYRAHVENPTTSGFDIVLEASAGSGGDATATVSVEWMVTR